MSSYSYKFLHVSDTHLSRNYPAVQGMLRLRAFNAAFNQVIQTAIKEKVDFIIHTGDLFETSKPEARVVQFTRRRLQLLHKKKIPFILIRGNHGGSYTGTGVIAGVAHDYVAELPEEKRASIDILTEKYPLIILIDPDVGEKYSKHGFAYTKVHIGEDLDLVGMGYRGKGLSNALRKYYESESSGEKDQMLMLHSFIAGFTSVPPGKQVPTVEEIVALSNKLRYVAIGHDHSYRERKIGSVQFLCTGATEPRDFSESGTEHFCTICKISDQDLQINRIPIKSIHRLIYRRIQPDRAQSATWYHQELNEVIKEIKSLKDPDIFVKIKLRGLLSSGFSIGDIKIREFDKELEMENLRYKALDCTELNITPVTTTLEQRKEQPILADILKKSGLQSEDIKLTEKVFHEVQLILDDKHAFTSAGRVKTEIKHRIREFINDMWKLEE